VIVSFIDDHRHEFGVEPIVRALKGTAARIAVSSYYAVKKRQPSARVRRDQALMVVIQDVYEANYSCYGCGRCGRRSTATTPTSSARWPAARWSG
jgi:putative transposase